MLLTLDDRDQSLVHRLLLALPQPGDEFLPPDVVDALVRLVPCDVVELAEAGSMAVRVGGTLRSTPDPVAIDTRTHQVVHLVCETPRTTVVTLSLRRHRAPFTARDVAMLRMVEPVITWLIRRRLVPGDEGGLSGSERRVLALVASGASNAEVAAQLSVSVSTVRKHLEHSYRKLGVTNRTAAVAALRDGRPVLPLQREGSPIG